jgi:HSP20 family protein
MLSVVLTPQVEVSETDKEMRITAELPGIDPKEVEVSLMDDVLSIRAEKSSKQESKDQSYHLAERSYGTFTRYLRLPFKPDPGQVQAVVKNGVVAITIPKPPESQQKAHKIEVRQDEGATDQGQAEATSQRATTRQQDTRQAASAS